VCGRAGTKKGLVGYLIFPTPIPRPVVSGQPANILHKPTFSFFSIFFLQSSVDWQVEFSGKEFSNSIILFLPSFERFSGKSN
jgi:hypothetical protein